MRKEHLEIARALYHPTEEVEAIVLKLIGLFDAPLPNGVVISDLSFPKNKLKIGDLSVKKLVRTKDHCGIEIHWYPNYNISTKKDPFCSVFVLKQHEIKKIYNTLIVTNCKQKLAV